MATTTILPAPSDTSVARVVTAHHTIGIEEFHDHRCPEAHHALVERFEGEVVRVWCRDVDVLRGATLDQVGHEYARQFEADYVVAVTA
jgi:hypothetical protein